MKKILVSIALVCAYLPTAAFAEEFLSEDARKAVGCGKTHDGVNLTNGWKYRSYAHDTCDKVTIHFLTGDLAGKTFDRAITRYPSGENCAKLENGRDICTKLKDASNGTYHAYATNGKDSGKHVNTLTNFVDGNQLQ